jgi:prevent-host-death family protein
MTMTIQSTDLRRRVREVLDRVRLERKPVVVRVYDAPQAAIIPYEDFEAYQAWQARQQKRAVWLAELQTIAEEVSARAALPEDEASVLIEEAIGETRAS